MNWTQEQKLHARNLPLVRCVDGWETYPRAEYLKDLVTFGECTVLDVHTFERYGYHRRIFSRPAALASMQRIHRQMGLGDIRASVLEDALECLDEEISFTLSHPC